MSQYAIINWLCVICIQYQWKLTCASLKYIFFQSYFSIWLIQRKKCHGERLSASPLFSYHSPVEESTNHFMLPHLLQTVCIQPLHRGSWEGMQAWHHHLWLTPDLLSWAYFNKGPHRHDVGTYRGFGEKGSWSFQ